MNAVRALLSRFAVREAILYVSAAAVTIIVTTIALQLWNMHWSVPIQNTGDTYAVINLLNTTHETGWYEVQPRVGAPFGLVMHDYPIADHLHIAIMGLFMLVVPKVGVALNLYFLLGFPLAALTATWFFRSIGLRRVLAGVLAVAFATAFYHFWRFETHLFLASYWPIPLLAVLVVRVLTGRPMWTRGSLPGALTWLTWRNAGTVAILLICGSATQYYAVFDVILLAIAGVIALARHRSWRRLGGTVVAAAVITVTFFANVLPDLLYEAGRTPNYAGLDRPLIHVDWFAIRLAMLFLPNKSHHFGPFADIYHAYESQFGVYTDVSLGILAGTGIIIGVLGLCWAAISFRAQRQGPAPANLRLNLLTTFGVVALWIFFFAAASGLSAFVALFLTSSLRGWDRFSIYLVLIGLACLGLAVDLLRRRLRPRTPSFLRTATRRRIATGVLAFATVLLIFWDQTPATTPPYEADAKTFTEDATYVAQLEAALPAGAMVLNLPYQPFPEGPAIVNDMRDYDYFRLVVQSTDLRWSYGGMKGRPEGDWPKYLSQSGTEAMVQGAAAAGFAGISIDRLGYADRGAALESELREILGDPAVVSSEGTYSFWSLEGTREFLIDSMGHAAFDDLGYRTLHPAFVYGVPPGLTITSDSPDGTTFEVSGQHAQFAVVTAADRPVPLMVSFFITGGPGVVTFVLPDGSRHTVTVPDEGAGTRFEVDVPPGTHYIEIESRNDTTYQLQNLQSYAP